MNRMFWNSQSGRPRSDQYENKGANLLPTDLLGRAYLRLKEGALGEADFEKVIGHSDIVGARLAWARLHG